MNALVAAALYRVFAFLLYCARGKLPPAGLTLYWWAGLYAALYGFTIFVRVKLQPTGLTLYWWAVLYAALYGFTIFVRVKLLYKEEKFINRF
ncbi:hypothetical protein AOR04_20870 [Pseudoalteromonas sp. 1_2015MBL_MicDiv]|nr:hypothetical protein AOR04_20870 [Pseudoalteromonas sp. 1_2015MBL_MicDiv]